MAIEEVAPFDRRCKEEVERPAKLTLYAPLVATMDRLGRSAGWTHEEVESAERFFEELLGEASEVVPVLAEAELFFQDLVGLEFEAHDPSPRAPTRAAITRSARVRWVQTALNAAMRSALAIDGDLGPRTRQVLTAFQRREGTVVDGRLLSDTLHRLAAASSSVPTGVWLQAVPTLRGRSPDLSVVCPRASTVLGAFRFGQATLTDAHRRAVGALAQNIAASQGSGTPVHLVCLDGHTDSVGAQPGNVALGRRRARAVQDELLSQLAAIDPSLARSIGIWPTSSGESRPVAPNDTDANRARNRRVVVGLNRRWADARTQLSIQAEEDGADEGMEQATAGPFRVEVGVAKRYRATFRGPRRASDPGYRWTVSDSSVASARRLGDGHAHPSRGEIIALRPGGFTVTVTHQRTGGQSSTVTANFVATAPAISITRPAADTIWPLLHEPEQAAFLTQGIHQGGAAWTSTTGSGNPTVTHHDLANPTGRTGAGGVVVRAHERGLVVTGSVQSAATGVNVEVWRGGTAIPLKASATATTTVPLVGATLAAPGAGASTRTFEAVIFLDGPSQRFGEVEVRATAVGLSPSARAHARVLLVGVQVALVDDRTANANGQVAGSVLTENDERFVLDFLSSPQANRLAISNQTRARRMIVYDIAHRSRPLSSAIATAVRKPEMPMWMAELHLVGVDGTALAAFMRRRTANTLQIEADWSLSTSWDGPNSGSTTRPFTSSETWTHTSTVNLSLTAGGAIDGLQSSGAVLNALTPVPSAPAFPVTGRRSAAVKVGGGTRRWGRTATAIARPTVLIEHQPNLVVRGDEVMRAGDGELKLTALRIDGTTVDPGRIGTAPPPTGTPVAMVPTFRVRGTNIAVADRRPLVDALVQEFVNGHATDAWVALLPLATWQETMWRIVQHESIGGNHFEHRGLGRRRFSGRYFGHEPEMPMFGAPAGYGWGQLDNPPVTENAAFSFVDNVRQAIDLFIDSKARAAHGALSAHFSAATRRRDRAVLQREAVRRYNGGGEFHWNGTTFEIQPTIAQRDAAGNPNPRLNYPNGVLGTTVTYWNGTAAAATFPWPIAFGTAQFGPTI